MTVSAGGILHLHSCLCLAYVDPTYTHSNQDSIPPTLHLNPWGVYDVSTYARAAQEPFFQTALFIIR
eukprot:11657198-Ditylum_brightwellii.AAC.1